MLEAETPKGSWNAPQLQGGDLVPPFGSRGSPITLTRFRDHRIVRIDDFTVDHAAIRGLISSLEGIGPWTAITKAPAWLPDDPALVALIR